MRTPITLITGYLGAGKTTLLRHIIDNTKGRKIAVLMNEFGDIGIDADVIKGEAIEIVELKGGCVCCSLTGEFQAAVEEIRDKINPEVIVIETTGVAEPDAIVGDITENMDDVRLDAVVTVVDAYGMVKFPTIGHTGRVQIEMADIILLNKVDVVDEDELGEIEDRIKELNPKALLFRTSYSEIDVNMILDVKMEGRIIKNPEEKHYGPGIKMDHFTYVSDDRMDKDLLENVFAEMPVEVVRAKGFVLTDQGSFLLNFVFGRTDMEKFEAKTNQLVFIGRDIEKFRKEISNKLKQCEL